MEDVVDRESFDLRTTREGSNELHVDVKGTTGLGETVILTRNEVQHLKSWPDVDLFIVTEIAVADRDTDNPTTSRLSSLLFTKTRREVRVEFTAEMR